MKKLTMGSLLVFAASVLVLLTPQTRAGAQGAGKWITAWGTSQNGQGNTAVTNATVRMLARVTIAGDAVRIRLDNTFSKTPLAVGKAYVGQRNQDAALVAGSNRQVFFGKAANVTVPAGGTVESDPVQIQVLAQQDLAVSLFIPGADMKPSQHGGAVVTSYATANGAGDHAAAEDEKPFTVKTTAMYWLKSIDVLSSSSTGAIVAFGDSITDGTCSTLDAHDRWEDYLAMRLMLEAAGQKSKDAHKAMVNEGIGGNTVTQKGTVPLAENPGIERLDRDVLTHKGVTHVVMFMGTNDLRRGAPAQQVMDGMQDIAKRVKAAGMKIYGVTIIPRHNRAPEPNNSGWNPDRTKMRNEINQWMRTKGPFDGVIDFDKVVQDPKNPDLIAPAFNCGDGIHPTPRGYLEMGTSVRLDLFK